MSYSCIFGAWGHVQYTCWGISYVSWKDFLATPPFVPVCHMSVLQARFRNSCVTMSVLGTGCRQLAIDCRGHWYQCAHQFCQAASKDLQHFCLGFSSCVNTYVLYHISSKSVFKKCWACLCAVRWPVYVLKDQRPFSLHWGCCGEQITCAYEWVLWTYGVLASCGFICASVLGVPRFLTLGWDGSSK